MSAKINKILNYISERSFLKLYSRNTSLFMFVIFSGGIKELNKIKGLYFSELAVSRNEFMDIYGRGIELLKIKRKLLEKILVCPSIKEYYENQALPIFKKYSDFTKKIQSEYSGKPMPAWLALKDFSVFVDLVSKLHALLWIIFLTDMVVDGILRKQLSAYADKHNLKGKIQSLTELIATPLKLTAILKEQDEFLKIIADKKKRQSLKNLLHKHRQKWCWFPCYNPSDTPYNLSYYLKAADSYSPKTAGQKLIKIREQRENNFKKYNKFINSIKDKNFKKLAILINRLSFYREYRNDVRREGLWRIQPLFKNIAGALGLSLKDTCYLTPDEIKRSLKSGVLAVKLEIVKNREKGFAFLADHRGYTLIDGGKAIARINRQISQKQKFSAEILLGISASPGAARGKAIVIDCLSKLKDIKKNNILVTSMTAPDYVPAMKKAAAVITDEGGITCHAAIISRELKIPCIVGTKIATDVLKDGDLVEVDANKGIVKIIK